MPRADDMATTGRMRPDEDPGWESYGETILRVHSVTPFEVDLAAPISTAHREAFRAAGLPGSFGLLTPENPRGRDLTPAENAARLRRFHDELVLEGHHPIPVDGLSPDRRRVEHGAALDLPRKRVVALAARWEQSAIYWFDGEAMWVIGVLTDAPPWRLGPR